MHAPSPSPAQPFRLGEREFIAMMAFCQALQALAIDIMLPALGIIARDLGSTDPNQRQLIVGLFLFGAGLGSLLPGTLADRFGRKPVLLFCLGSYVAMSLAGALVQVFDTLVVLRLIQAFGSGGLMVLPMAIIRDRFEGDRMARTQSLIAVIFLVVPMLAPSIGQAVLLVASWRWIFGLMAMLALAVMLWVALRLPETLHPEFRQPIRPAVIARNMGTALATRESIGYVLGGALIIGALWGYIQSSQQLVAEHFGAGKAFPLIFGGMALAMAAANFGNSRIVERFGARRVSHTALLVYLLVGVVHVALAWGDETLWQFVPPMTAAMCLMGFIGANFQSIAIQPFARIAGAASSAQAFVRNVAGSILGAVLGQHYDGTARPLSYAILGAGVFCLLLVAWSERGRLFRRLTPPGAKRPMVVDPVGRTPPQA
jgi:DHA1 family bicyclomycin/chloramphenicol resistance-like MFS transporter